MTMMMRCDFKGCAAEIEYGKHGNGWVSIRVNVASSNVFDGCVCPEHAEEATTLIPELLRSIAKPDAVQ